MFSGPKNNSLNFLDSFILVLILVGNAVFLHFNAFRYFHFYDMCFSLDGGWRILNGQKPYVDFIYFSGPIHLYMHAFFLKLFGFGKAAIFAHLVVVHSLVIILTYFMARRRMPDYFAWPVIILTMTSFYWPVSHPWHDQSAHLWGILAIAVLIWQLPFKDKRHALATGGFLSLMAVLSFMTKTNIGAAYGLIFLVVCFSVKERQKAVLGYFGGIVVGMLFMRLLISDPHRYFEQAFSYSLLTAHQRLSGFLNFSQWFVNYYWLPCLIILGNAWSYRRGLKEWMVLFAGIFFVAVVSIVSGQMIQSANISLWGIFMTVGLIVFFKIPYPEKFLWRRKIYRLSAIFLMVITLGLIALSTRDGLNLQAWEYISGYPPSGNYNIAAPALQGWSCDEVKGRVLDELAVLISKKIPKNQSLLVLSDLQILYALTGRDSYRGIPILVLRENHMPVPGPQLLEVQERLRRNPPDWIVADIDSYSQEIPYIGMGEEIKTHYYIVWYEAYYALFKRKK